jgi:GR25 family glycosyltransferase involved in LPS biosynthesis
MLKSISEIKNALYINLESRTDRNKHVTNQLKLLGIPAERFNAVKLPDGALGCSMSHLRCLQMAKEKGWDHVLICEDDITFTNPVLFTQQLNKFLSKQEKWDVVLLAGNNMPPYKPVEDYCVQVTRCQTTTGYLVKSHYYDKLIENIKTGMNMLVRNRDMHKIYAIDKYWFLLQDKDLWFLITPLSVVQREDYSDIEKRRTNYTKIMVDLDKRYMFEQPKIENMMNIVKPGGGVSFRKMDFI